MTTTAPGACLVSEGADPEVLEVHLLGAIDCDDVAQLVEELEARSTARPYVLVDLRQVIELTPAARTALVGLARSVARRSRRRAWLARSPRGRGLALWVLHVCPDPHAQVVGHPDAAVRWLHEDLTRTAAHEQGMRRYATQRQRRAR